MLDTGLEPPSIGATTIKDQDTEYIHPLKYYDKRPWWSKAEDTSRGAFNTEEAVGLLERQAEIAHQNAAICHNDRLQIHEQVRRRFVTPTYHGGGGCAAKVVAMYNATETFYATEEAVAVNAPSDHSASAAAFVQQRMMQRAAPASATKKKEGEGNSSLVPPPQVLAAQHPTRPINRKKKLKWSEGEANNTVRNKGVE